MPSRRRSARKNLPDKHWLYQWAVQEPENEVRLFERAYRRLGGGRRPRILREDFCGTGLVACTWVASGGDREAYGLDLDPEPLNWGLRHNASRLGAAADRLDLRRADVRTVTQPRADVLCALNFSYLVFHRREDLVAYFRAARASLALGGIFILDAYGGWESQQLKDEPRPVEAEGWRFTYVWRQAEFNPIDGRARCHIDFLGPGRRVLRRAFTYDWRLYSLQELADALEDAGFRRIEAYWDIEPDPDSPVDYRPRKRAENRAGWLAYLVAAAEDEAEGTGAGASFLSRRPRAGRAR